MVISPLQNRYPSIVAALAFALLTSLAAADREDYSLGMEFAPVNEVAAEIMSGENAMLPKDGMVLVFGRLDHAGFYIEDIGNLAVETPERGRIPVFIDSSSILLEFDGIVSLLAAFEISEQEAQSGGSAFRITWGELVQASNTVVERIRIDGENRSSYREFRWQEALASEAGGEAPFSTITVIADSTAEYHFLWYLLPMGLVFVLLTIRKIRARDSST